MKNTKKLLLTSTLLLVSSSLLLAHQTNAQSTTTITLDPNTPFQTITAWEATAQSGQETNPHFTSYRTALFNQAINELGITRLRVEITGGSENQVDWWTSYNNGNIEYDLRNSTGTRICPTDSSGNPVPTPYYRYVRGTTVDDNDTMSPPGIPSNQSGRNPLNSNPNGFQFAQFDHHMDNVIIPYKNAVQASGKQFLFNLEYVAFHRQNCLPYLYNVHTDPLEYAEFMATTVKHLQSKYNLLPNVIEPILEPDNTNYFNGTYIAKVIIETDNMLRANGITGIKYIAPSNTSMANAINYYDAMITEFNRQGKIPSDLIEEFVYHRYSGVSDSNLQAIASRANRDNVNTSMLEHINSGYQDLHKDLKLANNSAWQQYTLAFGYSPSGGGSYISVPDQNNATAPVELTTYSKYLRQYLKFIKPGAVRIGATIPGCDNNSPCTGTLDPLAFINNDGAYVVVIKATSAGNFSIANLPPGTYGIKYTINTGTGYNVDLPDQTITSSQNLTTSIPNTGVITIYGKTSSPSPSPSNTPTLGPSPSPTNSPTPIPSTQPDISAGLIGHWTFDEGSGNTVSDSSPNDNTGTIQGNANWIPDGKYNHAIFFDGLDDGVIIPAHPSINDQQPYTLSFWIRSPQSGYIVSKRSLGQTGYWRLAYEGNAFTWFKNTTQINNSVAATTQTNTIPDNAWHHIVFTWDGSFNSNGLHFYIDGQETNYQSRQTGLGNILSDAANNLTFGYREGGSSNFIGELDDIRFYNRVISPEEITILADQTQFGDINTDGSIDINDATTLISEIFFPTGRSTDLNADTTTSLLDLFILIPLLLP